MSKKERARKRGSNWKGTGENCEVGWLLRRRVYLLQNSLNLYFWDPCVLLCIKHMYKEWNALVVNQRVHTLFNWWAIASCFPAGCGPSVATVSRKAWNSDIFLKFVYLFWERVRVCAHRRVHKHRGGAERGRENPKQVPYCQRRAGLQACTHEPWDRDLSQNQQSDAWLTEPPRCLQKLRYFYKDT